MKILIAGSFSNYCLESSYQRAFIRLGHAVSIFDIDKELKKYVKLGKIGSTIQAHIGMKSWMKKLNKEFALYAMQQKPDVIICAGNTIINFGSIGFIKSVSQVKTALLWPDPLINLDEKTVISAPIWDLMATFSKAQIPVLEQLGFRNVQWLPFAADKDAHYEKYSAGEKKNDLAFVGGWRPEREESLVEIITRIPGIRIKVYGPFWNRCSNAELKKSVDARPLYGKAFTDVVQDSLINLNVIDSTGFPAGNMRFYEIPVAGGFELCSAAPELEDEFPDGKEIFYFHNNEELVEKVKFCVANKPNVAEMAGRMQQKIMDAHLYETRATQLLELVNAR